MYCHYHNKSEKEIKSDNFLRLPVCTFCVEPVGFAWPCPASAAGALLGLRLRDRRHHQAVHPGLAVVHLHKRKVYEFSL